jgi:carbamoyltransferase
MTAILGISAFYHDSAAALVIDGEIVAAVHEERHTRKKQDQDFPVNAIDSCLEQAGITREELDYVGFYDKPYLKFERILETYLAHAPRGFRSFAKAMPVWLKQKLWLPHEMRKALGKAYSGAFIFTEHHESHAAAAFFPSPFGEAAILTFDGVGEWATASFGVGRGNRIQLSDELHFPHSLGLLYTAFTYYTGFKVNSDEYKMMGLAPYGEPKYYDVIVEELLDLKDDGSSGSRVGAHTARHGHRGLDPEGDRGDHAARRASRPCRDGHEESLPFWRRGPQLRGEWAYPSRGPVRRRLDPACCGRRGQLAGCCALHLAPVA